MTDIARHPTNQTQPTGLSSVDPTGLLLLTGDDPVTVFVKQDPLTKHAVFASKADGTYFAGGISWTSGPTNALFVTFSMTPPVSGIECELPYSVPYEADHSKLDLCLLPVSEAKVMYQFFVNFSDGTPRHDPVIIITPITATGNGSAVTGAA